MFDMKVVEPVKEEWAAPTVFSLREKHHLAFCRVLEGKYALIDRNSYPTPRMVECIGPLG